MKLVPFTPIKRKPLEFDPHSKRAAKRPWIKFELADPAVLKLLIVKDKQAFQGTVTDPLEIEMLNRRAAHAPDGRLVGIYIAAGTLHSPGMKVAAKNPDGSPKLNVAGEQEYHEIPESYVQVPASVAVQREQLGEWGEQNLPHVVDGQVHRLLLTFDSLKNVELFDMANKRDGIPAHRIATQNPNWKAPEDAVSRRKKPSPQRKVILPKG
jgi:hypothetical protein